VSDTFRGAIPLRVLISNRAPISELVRPPRGRNATCFFQGVSWSSLLDRAFAPISPVASSSQRASSANSYSPMVGIA
jgi:hypothetical protein